MTAISSRSEKDRYLPDSGANEIGGIPPACRNHRDPTGPDTPTAIAASSLVRPSAILPQNARSRSRRTGGRPGERITARPVNAAAQSGTRPIKTPFPLGVLRRPLEPGQYTSIAFAETLVLEGIAASIGSVGDAYDNALAESTIGLFKTEAVSKRSPFLSGPMKTIDDVEFATMGWVDWFNQRRLHSTLDYLTPDEFEEVYYSQESALHPEMLQA